MSSFGNQLSLLFLLITVLSSHARESQFFTNISPITSNDVVPVNTQPNFLPETGNGHGLYGKDSDKLPTPAAESKYLPENYNPFSYVTEPEGVVESAKLASTSNGDSDDTNLYDGPQNYQLTPEEKQAEYRNSHYSGGGGDLARLSRGVNSFDRVEAQGMSDTRSFENGRYHYDIGTEKYNRNHPYESGKNEFNGRDDSYDGNGENGYEFDAGKNFVAGYEDRNELEGNVNLMP